MKKCAIPSDTIMLSSCTCNNTFAFLTLSQLTKPDKKSPGPLKKTNREDVKRWSKDKTGAKETPGSGQKQTVFAQSAIFSISRQGSFVKRSQYKHSHEKNNAHITQKSAELEFSKITHDLKMMSVVCLSVPDPGISSAPVLDAFQL